MSQNQSKSISRWKVRQSEKRQRRRRTDVASKPRENAFHQTEWTLTHSEFRPAKIESGRSSWLKRPVLDFSLLLDLDDRRKDVDFSRIKSWSIIGFVSIYMRTRERKTIDVNDKCRHRRCSRVTSAWCANDNVLTSRHDVRLDEETEFFQSLFFFIYFSSLLIID